MNKSIMQATIIAAAVLLVGVAIYRLGRRNPDPGPLSQQVVPEPAECPHSGISYVPGDQAAPAVVLNLGTPNQIGLSGDITSIPEFHDCQRFPVVDNNNELRYGPLVAIFARKNLETVDTLPEFRAGAGVAVATIVSWDSGNPQYSDLGIQGGANCLYLQRPPGENWKAFIIPNGMSGDCRPTRGANGTPTLQVREVVEPGFEAEDHPPVAVWDWDETNRKQYIGIRCGKAWCEIGALNFVSSDRIEPPAQFATGQASRVFRIKGWYDRQIVAVMRSGKLVPSGVMGVVVPYPDLGNREEVDYGTPEGLPVAFLYVNGDIYDRPEKWNLKAGWTPGITNVLFVATKSTWPDLQASVLHAGPGVNSIPANWRLAMPGANNVTITFRGTTASGVKPVGTARWRWEVTDESVWYACPLGCCEAN